MGLKTQEVGFTIKFPNETVLLTRSPGATFQSNKLFKIFCSLSACPMPLTTDYYLTMTDSSGNGWNGNILAFKQGNITKKFGSEMAASNMRTFGPIPITLSRFQSVTISVYTLGTWTAEIGF